MTSHSTSTNVPADLRVEHHWGDVLGSYDVRPRLSWRLPDGATRQDGYEIKLDGAEPFEADSPQNVLVEWPFGPLGSRQSVDLRVRVRTDLGVSEWSSPRRLELGLVDTRDWSARWIEPDEIDLPPSGERPVWLLQHHFMLDATDPNASTARLYATAHGVYETFLNGQRVGDPELTPGFTYYPASLQVQAYDVTDLLLPGRNEWETRLSDGWFRGRFGNWQDADGFGQTVAFLAQLEVGDQTITTGADWTCTTGSIVAADLMAGLTEDRRIWPGIRRPVKTVDLPFENLTGSPAPPVRRIEEIRPAGIEILGNGDQIIDLGQNINGWIRLDPLGEVDTELTLVHGEATAPDGAVATSHIGLDRPYQVDKVISDGVSAEPFEPRHTMHGFQFVGISGAQAPLGLDDVKGIVVHTDLHRTGWFSCSNEDLNRFHEVAMWSFRDNACDIPTDCPQRERAGWTGDWQIFVPTAAFLYDVAGFSEKWLRDLRSQQLEDGLVPNVIPDPPGSRATPDGFQNWVGLQGSSGWGDAAVIVPWEIYQRYGDRKVLEDLWPTMVRWIGYAQSAAATKRHRSRAASRPTPAPHEEYLWDGGWHWGEWCEPETGGEPWYDADQGSVGTAYLHYSSRLAARIGRVLGHHDEAARLDVLAARTLDAWQTEYLGVDGILTPDTQANYVRALAFDLIPTEARAAVANRLVHLVREAGNHLGTGFLATPLLLPVLADAGHLDVAYDLLLQRTPPSWLGMVDRGATTVWENWEGIDDEGLPHDSLNHYSKGAVITFLHRYVAGIQPIDDELAYSRFRIAPQPGGGLTWAKAALETPHGRIESAWEIGDERFRIDVTVPAGTTAELVLPDGTAVELAPGTSTHRCSAR